MSVTLKLSGFIRGVFSYGRFNGDEMQKDFPRINAH